MSRESLALAVLLILASFGRPSNASAQQTDCGKAQSTADQAECAIQELASAEQELKEAFAQALGQYTSTVDQDKETAKLPKFDRDRQVQWEKRMRRDLKVSQRAWLDYRQSTCGTVADTYDGGTFAAVAVPTCKADMTRARAKFLHDYFGNDR